MWIYIFVLWKYAFYALAYIIISTNRVLHNDTDVLY